MRIAGIVILLIALRTQTSPQYLCIHLLSCAFIAKTRLILEIQLLRQFAPSAYQYLQALDHMRSFIDSEDPFTLEINCLYIR